MSKWPDSWWRRDESTPAHAYLSHDDRFEITNESEKMAAVWRLYDKGKRVGEFPTLKAAKEAAENV